ncbi:hypothetical protein BST95_01535 [Halioglobus japonicus]|uniref:Uncharacterized protein n=1 Tax=Halioglobus japonicus TaxID=930805 RepID=A0AAP8MBZ0_9GAMM|nr:hypothetical protein BST95_01535 [Halioglobus japonicus]PLW85002.1 hypothetical protein C0029_15795 [Halioglobus japonicus]
MKKLEKQRDMVSAEGLETSICDLTRSNGRLLRMLRSPVRMHCATRHAQPWTVYSTAMDEACQRLSINIANI